MTKNNMTRIGLGLCVALASLMAITAQASTANYMSVSPATLTVNPGVTFTPSVMVQTSGDKICSVKGTLVLNNLTCKSITLSNDVIGQISCDNLNFLVGIPSCTTVGQTLFNVAVKGTTAGPASISISNLNIVGEGVSVGNTSVGGNYTVVNPVATTTVAIPPASTNTTPIVQDTATTPENPIDMSQSADVSQAAPAAQWITANWFWLLLIILLLIIAYYYYKSQQKKKNQPQ